MNEGDAMELANEVTGLIASLRCALGHVPSPYNDLRSVDSYVRTSGLRLGARVTTYLATFMMTRP